MGNTAAKAFKNAPVHSGKVTGGEVIDLHGVSTAPGSFKVKTSLGMSMSSTTQIADEAGNVLFTAKASSSGFCRKLKATVSDSQGMVCIATGKHGMTKGTFQILRPMAAFKGQQPVQVDTKAGDGLLEQSQELFLFAVCEVKTSIASATASYSIVRGDPQGEPVMVPAYTAKTKPGLVFRMAVEDADGTLVAKVQQPGCDPTKSTTEVGQGVDVLAVSLIGGFIGFAAGSGGGGVGGAIGAGAI